MRRSPLRFATEESVNFSPTPCWAHLPPEAYRERVATLVENVEAEAALARSLKGLSVLGVEAILAKDPLHRPAVLARSPAPHWFTPRPSLSARLSTMPMPGSWPPFGKRQRDCAGEIAMPHSPGQFPTRPPVRGGIGFLNSAL